MIRDAFVVRRSIARSQSKGFALPAVAFLIVVIALIVAAMERINSGQQVTSTLGMQSSRAYMAAISGVEWTAYEISTNNTCPSTGTISGMVLNGFVVELVSCDQSSDTEGSLTIDSYEVTVLATYGGRAQLGQPDFSSREVTVSLVVES